MNSGIGGTRPTKGMLWGVKKTTPGMIAMAATLVSFDLTHLLFTKISIPGVAHICVQSRYNIFRSD